MKDIFLAIISIIFSFVAIVLLILLGWYIVWKLCLSRFRFVRELFGGVNDNTSETETKKTKVKKARRD